MKDSFKEDTRTIICYLLEEEDTEDFYVQDQGLSPDGRYRVFSLQTPVARSDGSYEKYQNYIYYPVGADDSKYTSAVEKRMHELAQHRNYPAGSFFITPWGMYLIHGKTIGKI